jgi:2,3-bisphosphoglycerate-independent phosphoglycerate mutase
MGDSNVGHLNIGAGRVVYQDLVRISMALKDDELSRLDAWQGIMRRLRHGAGRLHLVGLLSDGGVHSHIDHLRAVLEECRKEGVSPYLHLQLDGRDAPPVSGIDFLRDVEDLLVRLGVGSIATVMGRYYGMDRDQRWERTEAAYVAMVDGRGKLVENFAAALRESYQQGITDEFVKPHVSRSLQPEARVKDADELLFFNFRADRMRQITQSFWEEGQVGFTADTRPRVNISTFTQYHRSYPFPFFFPPQNLANTLGEVLSKQNLRQLRLAETEKYAHVTFFFNGGLDTPFPGEERILIPSPKVATYDLEPAMSARQLTSTLLAKLGDGHDFIVMNYANLDMVGHTGVFEAACEAVKTIDECLGTAVREILKTGGIALVTADHGNAEQMLDEQGGVYTAHTLNKVPFVLAQEGQCYELVREGRLADVAPTVLELTGLVQPVEMTGRSLLERRVHK